MVNNSRTETSAARRMGGEKKQEVESMVLMPRVCTTLANEMFLVANSQLYTFCEVGGPDAASTPVLHPLLGRTALRLISGISNSQKFREREKYHTSIPYSFASYYFDIL